MKSILQSVLIYASVSKLETLDQKSKEIIWSFIYTYWLLKFSDQPTDEPLDVASSSYGLWSIVYQAYMESGDCAKARMIVGEELIEVFEPASLESITRLVMVTTVKVDIEDTKKILADIQFNYAQHIFGNMLVHQLST